MKRLIFVIYIVLSCCVCKADTAINELQDIFYGGNTLYSKGKYEEAFKEYKKILDKGYQSGPLYYNMGNCSFKSGYLGRAVLYYKRAMRLIPSDPELAFNYRYVKSLAEDKINAPAAGWFVRKVRGFAGILPFGGWILFIAVLWVVASVITGIWIFYPSSKGFMYAAVSAFVLIFFLICISAYQYRFTCKAEVVVMQKETPVRYGPAESEVEAFVLHEGTEAELVKEQGDWYRVRLKDGKNGWLPKSSAERI